MVLRLHLPEETVSLVKQRAKDHHKTLKAFMEYALKNQTLDDDMLCLYEAEDRITAPGCPRND